MLADPAARLPAGGRSRAGGPLPFRAADRCRAARSGSTGASPARRCCSERHWRCGEKHRWPISPVNPSRASRCRGSRKRVPGRSKIASTRISPSAATSSCSPSSKRSSRAIPTVNACGASSCSRCIAPVGRRTRSPHTKQHDRCSSTSSVSNPAVSFARWKLRSWSTSRRSRRSSSRRSGPTPSPACSTRSTAPSRTPPSSTASCRRVATRLGERSKPYGERSIASRRAGCPRRSRPPAPRRWSSFAPVASIADRVLDRRSAARARAPPRRIGAPGTGRGAERRESPARTRACCDSNPRTRPGTSAGSALSPSSLASVASTRCTGVVGASGSGKSSLDARRPAGRTARRRVARQRRVAAPARHPRRRSDARARARARTGVSCRFTRPGARPPCSRNPSRCRRLPRARRTGWAATRRS